jgi:hypothetical protein
VVKRDSDVTDRWASDRRHGHRRASRTDAASTWLRCAKGSTSVARRAQLKPAQLSPTQQSPTQVHEPLDTSVSRSD